MSPILFNMELSENVLSDRASAGDFSEIAFETGAETVFGGLAILFRENWESMVKMSGRKREECRKADGRRI